MIEKVYRFMKEQNMLTECSQVIVGVSGGADSVCLLTVLQRLAGRYAFPVSLTAVHVHHGIRGPEADRDEAFVRKLCAELGVPCICSRKNIPAFAKASGLTEEEAGRSARYAVFAKEADRLSRQTGQAVRIAVAHHMDDQAETVLMHLIRGSSLNGMGGMAPVRGAVIRPLLCVTRGEIEDYLRLSGQAYMTDSTNQDNGYTRNRIRNELIPQIREQFNPNFTRQAAALAEDMRSVQQYLEAQACLLSQTAVSWEVLPEGRSAQIALPAFSSAAPLVRRLVLQVLTQLAGSPKHFYRKHIEAVIALREKDVGRILYLPCGLCAKRLYDAVILYAVTETAGEESGAESPVADGPVFVPLSEIALKPVTVLLGLRIRTAYGWVSVRAVRFELLSENALLHLKNTEFSEINDYTKYFDYDKMRDNLCFRFRQAGDCITVRADGAARKLKKELIDRRIPQADRDRVLLLSSEQSVLWAVGIRRSEACRVDPATKRCMKISVIVQEEKGNETTSDQRAD